MQLFKEPYRKSNMVRDLLLYGFKVTEVAKMLDLHQPYVSKIKRELRESGGGYPIEVRFTLTGEDAVLLEQAGQPKEEFIQYLRDKYKKEA